MNMMKVKEDNNIIFEFVLKKKTIYVICVAVENNKQKKN